MVGSMWSLVDYKRRVSSSPTIRAAYDLDFPDIGIANSCFFQAKRPDILGLAVGGQMYDSFDFSLFIVYLNPIISECRKYTAIRTPLGYDAAGISILGSPNSLAK